MERERIILFIKRFELWGKKRGKYFDLNRIFFVLVATFIPIKLLLRKNFMRKSNE